MFKYPLRLGQLHPPVVLEEARPEGANTTKSTPDTVRHHTPTLDSCQSSNGEKEQARIRQCDGRANTSCELLEVTKRWTTICSYCPSHC